jgi:hypothetical protein
VFAQVQLVRDFPVRQAFRYETPTVSSRFAEMFMGDSGSEVLGFSVAFLGLNFIATKGARNASPLLAFPLLVAAFAVV